MSLYRYYISRTIDTPAPPLCELREVLAANAAEVIEKIKSDHRLPPGWPTVWAHVVVWDEGDYRGFESTRIR